MLRPDSRSSADWVLENVTSRVEGEIGTVTRAFIRGETEKLKSEKWFLYTGSEEFLSQNVAEFLGRMS